MSNQPTFLTRLLLAVFIGIAFCCAVPATSQVVQTPLPGKNLPQFVDPLPQLHAIVAGTGQITLNMTEFQVNVMPRGFVPANGQPYTGTWVWGYLEPGQTVTPTSSYIGPVIVAQRGTPTEIRFVNNLGTATTTNLLAWKNSTDQTAHWADPLGLEANMCAHMINPLLPGVPPSTTCAAHYGGPVPAVPHLHGGEVPPVLDGGPDAWFTSDGLHGHGYYTKLGAAANEAIYRYPNSQEAGPLWFHDHVLGLTRLNVYAGLAGAYLLTDPAKDPANLPELVPLVIQDRMFDTNGQLYFPAGVPFTPNPDHPYWVPEFVGDTIVVNGKVWPFVPVQPKRYRFLIINGSNARTYELSVTSGGGKTASIWQIGTDGGYLDAPVNVSKLLIMPGERADVVIDFAGAQGKSFILNNSARTPYPAGATPTGPLGRIVEFRVGACAGPCPVDTSFNPAAPGATLRATNKIVRLPGAPGGPAMVTAPGPTQNVQKVRQLTLNEVIAPASVVGGVKYPGGPLEVLVNNTTWEGQRQASGQVRSDFTAVTVGGITAFYSEIPNEGETEVWEIVNLTADAHPIHTHLTQFQLINRQGFDFKKYNGAYAAAFAGGLYVPGDGPPKAYNFYATAPNTPVRGPIFGGNPDITPFLANKPQPPAPNEAGWKDTIMVPPGMVTRFVVRYAPTDKPATAAPASLWFGFDPNAAGQGYVWHCHIIDHEDNEMMRPYAVAPNALGVRTYVLGADY